MGSLELLIVGGCFTDQGNISFEEHYHQVLKEKLENIGCKIELRIVRYERLSTCYQKIVQSVEKRKPDIVIFHVRVEPLLRIAKFFYRYLDEDNKIKKTFNVSVLGKNNSETHKHFINESTDSLNNKTGKENGLYLTLLSVNYLLGKIFLNWGHAFRLYMDLLKDIREMLFAQKTRLIIVGSVSRPRNFIENYLSVLLDRYSSGIKLNSNESYVKTLGTYSENDERLFFDNGIHVNKIGHIRIANYLYDVITDRKIDAT